MIEEARTITVTSATIVTLADAVELIDWAQKQPGLYATVSGRVDGSIYIEVGGTTADSKSGTLGDMVTWDGTHFTVTSPAHADPTTPEEASI